MAKFEQQTKDALKKAKTLQRKRDQVKLDIIGLLTDHHFASIPSPLDALKMFLRDGRKGYNQMRSRLLVREFEDLYVRLTKEKYTSYHNHGHSRFSDHKFTTKGFLERAEAINNKLFEIAFKLDEE